MRDPRQDERSEVLERVAWTKGGVLPALIPLSRQFRVMMTLLGGLFSAVGLGFAITAVVTAVQAGIHSWSGTSLFSIGMAVPFLAAGIPFVRIGLGNRFHIDVDAMGLTIASWRRWEVKWVDLISVEAGSVPGAKGSQTLGIWVRYHQPDGSTARRFIEDKYKLGRDDLILLMREMAARAADPS